MKSYLDDTPFITLHHTRITLPSHPDEYWDAKTAEAQNRMREMGIKHLFDVPVTKKPPVMRRRVA